MIDFVWAVLCSKSIVDQSSNNISLLEVMEQINLSPDAPIPVNIPTVFELVTFWSRADFDQPATGLARITILNPVNNEILQQEFEIDLTSYRRSRHRLGIQGLPVAELGKYIFQVESRAENGVFEVVAQVPLEIRSGEPE